MLDTKEWKKNNSPTINTKGLRIEELSKLNSNKFNQKEEYGVASRIKKNKIMNKI